MASDHGPRDARTPAITTTLRPPARRAVLGGILSGLVARFAWGQTTAGKHGKGNGNGKGKIGCKAGTKKCGKRCIPATSCCTIDDCNLCQQEQCRNGRCDCAPGAFRDAHGYCGTPPLCQVVDQLCERDNDCCSQQCNVEAEDGSLRCNRGLEACITDFDCLQGGGWHCRGFRCVDQIHCP